MFFICLYFLVFSCIISLCLMPLAYWLSAKLKVLDYPVGKKKHKIPMPLLGGVAIAGAFFLTIGLHLIMRYLLQNYDHLCVFLPKFTLYILKVNPHGLKQLTAIAGGGFLIFIIGLLDDITFFSIKRRLLAELAVAIPVIYFGEIKPQMYGVSEVVIWIVAIIWIIGITNSFNLLDGMDGLTAGVSLIAAAILTLFCFLTDQIMICFLLIIICGSCLGFLKHNWAPAKIYMGSSGSLFLGYLMATIPLSAAFMHQGSNKSALAMPIIILSVPIYDTLSVMAIRIWHQRSPFTPDHNHLFHRIQRLGLSVKQVVLIIYLLAFAIGISAMLLLYAKPWEALLIIIHIVAIYGVFVVIEMSGVRTKDRQQVICLKARSFFANTGTDEKVFFGWIRMLTCEKAEFEIPDYAIDTFALALAEHRTSCLEIMPENNFYNKSIPLVCKISSVWRIDVNRGFVSLVFQFKDAFEERHVQAYIASILYPDRGTAPLEKQ